MYNLLNSKSTMYLVKNLIIQNNFVGQEPH